MVTSEGDWDIVDDRAKNVEADAEAPKVVAKVADVGEGGGEVVTTHAVRFGDCSTRQQHHQPVERRGTLLGQSTALDH